ncbi:MAG: hypothetical protein WCK35_04720, partial [Chloroflexota bacterium]
RYEIFAGLSGLHVGENITEVTLTAGVPFTLPPIPRENREAALQQYTDEIMCQIAAILPERYRGVYAGYPRVKELLEGQAFQQSLNK